MGWELCVIIPRPEPHSPGSSPLLQPGEAPGAQPPLPSLPASLPRWNCVRSSSFTPAALLPPPLTSTPSHAASQERASPWQLPWHRSRLCRPSWGLQPCLAVLGFLSPFALVPQSIPEQQQGAFLALRKQRWLCRVTHGFGHSHSRVPSTATSRTLRGCFEGICP